MEATEAPVYLALSVAPEARVDQLVWCRFLA